MAANNPIFKGYSRLFVAGLYHRDSIFIAPAINALGGMWKFF